jgi:hypothetical protein
VATELTAIEHPAAHEPAAVRPDLWFEEFQAIYGPIRPLSPEEVAELFASAPFAAVLPMLDPADRAWLCDAIELTEPIGHPWLARLA